MARVVRRGMAGRDAYSIVEPAHMELARPSIADAFDACVALRARRGSSSLPYFLWPGSHWDRDIPLLAAEAAARPPGCPTIW